MSCLYGTLCQVFGLVSSAEMFQKFEVTSEAAVILLKKFDEGRNNLEGRDHRSKINIEEKAKVVAAA